MSDRNTWQLLRDLNEICHFQTREGKRCGAVSNSELKRWCQNKSVIINGKQAAWDAPVEYPITSFVLFPKNRITLI